MPPRQGREGANALGVAIGLEQPEIGPVGLPSADRLFGLGQIDGCCEVGTERCGQVLGRLDNGKGC